MIPVIYIHFGPHPDYLIRSMKQALLFGNKVVLIGDQAIHLSGVEYLSSDQYLDAVPQFEQAYVHMSSNSPDFEKICIKRWIILANYVQAKNCSTCFYSDSDVMLYCNVNEHPEFYEDVDAGYTLPEYQENYRWTASACCSYWKLKRLQAFKQFILSCYQPENCQVLQQKWNYHQENKLAGGVCDMTLLYLFHSKINFLSLSKVNSGKAFDQNYIDSENYFRGEYEMHFDKHYQKQVKKITWDKQLPFGYNLVLKEKIQLLALTEFARYVQVDKISLKTKLYRFKKSLEANVKRIFGPKTETPGWFGDYANWEEAQKACAGYDQQNILNKVKESVLKVKNGEAVYERDSVIFDRIHYSEPLVQSLKDSIQSGQLHVLDFGGSLGSSYFQHKSLFQNLPNFKWAVVEQEHFVEAGKNEIAEESLMFYPTLETALNHQKNQVLLLSSVLPYLPNPYTWIQNFLQYKFDYILIDRTAFLDAKNDRITKQVVPESIYKASYPAWFFNEQKFKQAFEKDYELLREFDSAFDPDGTLEDGVRIYRKGFYLKRRN